MKTLKALLLMLFLTINCVPAHAEVPSGEAARAAYAHIARLAGEWTTVSSKGWTGQLTYTIGGRGSVVMSVSRFANAPQNSMMTAFYLDNDRLMLTHFCQAKNQPRLVATEISPDGRRVHFSFLDATNMKSAQAGHMHEVIYQFIDENRMTSRWSWFQDGKKDWMEELTSTRASDAQSAEESRDARPGSSHH
jgi:hypothetical protein